MSRPRGHPSAGALALKPALWIRRRNSKCCKSEEIYSGTHLGRTMSLPMPSPCTTRPELHSGHVWRPCSRRIARIARHTVAAPHASSTPAPTPSEGSGAKSGFNPFNRGAKKVRADDSCSIACQLLYNGNTVSRADQGRGRYWYLCPLNRLVDVAIGHAITDSNSMPRRTRLVERCKTC